MTARDFYNKEEKYNVFSKLTSTGISDDLDKITEFAEDYHQTKLKLLGIANVVGRSEQLPYNCDRCGEEQEVMGTCECCEMELRENL